MTVYDRDRIAGIMAGCGDGFTDHLYRLLAHADSVNKARLASVFPVEAQHVVDYQAGVASSPNASFWAEWKAGRKADRDAEEEGGSDEDNVGD